MQIWHNTLSKVCVMNDNLQASAECTINEKLIRRLKVLKGYCNKESALNWSHEYHNKFILYKLL